MLAEVDPRALTHEQLRELIAAQLGSARTRSLALTDVLDDHDLVKQHSTLMSPFVWDLAHIANFEELWLLRETLGIDPVRPEVDKLYDAFEHPRSQRPSLPLLPPTEARAYLEQVRRKVLVTLERMRFAPDAPLLANGFVYAMIVQHEHQHDETMLATHQLRTGPRVLHASAPPHGLRGGPEGEAAANLPAERLVPAGPFVMGTSSDPWAYDNERPAHRVHLDAFWIDTTPVSNGDYLAFMADGGYDRSELWTTTGWEWRCRSHVRFPGSWVGTSHDTCGDWLLQRFGALEPLPLDEPVQHVCAHEADAFARWAGKRLPTEAEWEKAAAWDPQTRRTRRFPWGEHSPTVEHANLGQHALQPAVVGSYPHGASFYGVRQLIGDVWEWTSSTFEPYPGYRTFPYPEYSEVFFGSEYRVLRGGSWATDPTVCRNTFRNWDYPIRRQIFAGFRCARDGACSR